jgi:hypothetical protein
MHLNRRGKGLVAKQLASEILNLSAAQEMSPISLKWKAVQEQIVSSCALGLEAGKAEGDCLMDELKTVPDKLIVEDKYVIKSETNILKGQTVIMKILLTPFKIISYECKCKCKCCPTNEPKMQRFAL